MLERNAFLEKVQINNFLSFDEVELPLKPLTVLVGPNASGKSNVLEVLHLLSWLTAYGQLPNISVAPDLSSEVHPIRSTFQFTSKVKQTSAVYDLALASAANDASVNEETSISGDEYLPLRIVEEGLLVGEVKVISTLNGQFMLRDEDGKNETSYKPDALALKAAGDFGFKPVTSALAEFITRWEFHDFQPRLTPSDFSKPLTDIARRYTMGKFPSSRDFDFRDRDSFSPWSSLLLNWHDNDSARFKKVYQSLEMATGFKIVADSIRGVRQLCLLEGRDKVGPLVMASDGTLRLITYYIMLNDSETPPLIAIEEPEQNLHPGALNAIADFLEQLSERAQVIITTHSSQLLDCFDHERLSDSLRILLLRNPQGGGTEVTNLEEIRGNRPALDAWITDFGIGSAIFHSALLPEPMEESE